MNNYNCKSQCNDFSLDGGAEPMREPAAKGAWPLEEKECYYITAAWMVESARVTLKMLSEILLAENEQILDSYIDIKSRVSE